MNDPSHLPPFRRSLDGHAWQGVDRLAYKEEGSAPFKAVTRQTLFADPELACELRYFEIAAAGFSTLERHRHVHAVMILHGRGRGLVGTTLRPLQPHDLVTVPPLAWHQFRADPDQSLGFLCMVNADRDRPQLPTPTDLDRLRDIPGVAAFLDGAVAA